MKFEELRLVRVPKFLSEWKSHYPASSVATFQKAVAGAVDALIADGESCGIPARTAILKSLVESINELDDFIDTIAREDICDYFYEIGSLCEIPCEAIEDLLDDRDW